MTKAQVLKELNRVAKMIGRTPTKKTFEQHASIGVAPVAKIFGSWNKALKLVGLNDFKTFKREWNRYHPA